MRAIVKTAPGVGMTLVEVPRPVCGPTDVLIKVHAAGVCGTDLHSYRGEWDRPTPIVLGHEVVVEVTRGDRERRLCR